MMEKKVTILTGNSFYREKISKTLESTEHESSVKDVTELMVVLGGGGYYTYKFLVGIDKLNELAFEKKADLLRWIENGEIAISISNF